MTLTLHEGTTFLLSERNGDVHHGSDQGLYFQDSRFLARFEMRLDGEPPMALTARASATNQALFALTNPALESVAHKELSILRSRLLDEGLHEEIVIENYAEQPARFALSLHFEADFVHIFDIKQAVESGTRVHRHFFPVHQIVEYGAQTWVRLRREGLDAETAIGFNLQPTVAEGRATFDVEIPPRGRWVLWVQIQARPDPSAPLPADVCISPVHPRRDRARRRRQEQLEAAAPVLETDHPLLARAYRQAARDMVSLRMKGEDVPDGAFALAAGIPWYMALFGRDSLIASYQTLLHDPSLARGTLRALARLQGRRVDPVTAEEPGKILHEDRFGPLVGDPKYIPRFPYYGTIDATPLFLITLTEYVRCTGDLDLARELEGPMARAIEWMARFGDRDGDGFLEYLREGDQGLVNQGWKDSWDSVRFRDGRVAQGPIALVEVQGYACRALANCADLYAVLGDEDESRRLFAWAETLRGRLLEEFWLEERGFFAEALDGRKMRVDALTSNPGHLLWSDVLPPATASAVARVLMSDAMFSGYGIRTMGADEGGYNPISYHCGSVWPHDTGLIAEGLGRAGFVDEAARVIEGLLDALGHYPDYRLPELFAGYSARDFGMPIEYPSANRPQAWASGAVILLVRTLLGLDVDAIARRISLRPIVLPGLSYLALRGMPLGDTRVDVELEVRDGRALARVHGLPEGWTRVR